MALVLFLVRIYYTEKARKGVPRGTPVDFVRVRLWFIGEREKTCSVRANWL